MTGLAARLPDALVGLLPDLLRALHLVGEHRPQALGDVVALLGVQVHRVEHRAEHVVLALVVGAVADAHRARAFVALEVLERRLLQVPLARDPVHDLQRAILVALQVGHVLDEVVGLPVQPERVQAPQRERGVAHPAVAVVPVAFPVRRLGQRGGRRRDERAGGHEREALQRQRRALEVIAPGMIGVGAVGQPAAPEVARAVEVLLGLLGRARAAEPLGPGDRAEAPLAFDHRVTSVHAVALDPHAHVAVQAKLRPPVAGVERVSTLGAGVHHAPLRRRRAVLEHRLADHLHLHLALDAFDHPHQQMVGVEVGRRARVAGALLVVVPLPDRQPVHHAQPSLRGHPGRLDQVRARDVAPAGGHIHVVGAHAPAPGAAIEHRGEHARRVEVGHAHPLDRPVRGDQRAGVAVRQEAVVGDRRERRVGRERRRDPAALPAASPEAATLASPAGLPACGAGLFEVAERGGMLSEP